MQRASDLLTEDGLRLPLGKRTGAVMMEVYAKRDRIDEASCGQIEIVIDFKGESVSLSLKERGEPRRIE